MNSKTYEYLEPEISRNGRKRLEICVPIVRTFHNIAFPMSIVCCNEKTKGWFFSNFMNVYSYYNADDNNLEVNYDVQFFEDEVYHLNTEKISISTLDTISNKSIDILLLSLIDKNKYVCIYLDEYYIEGTGPYKCRHYNHEFLIFGYDIESNEFDCMFYGRDGQYKCRKIAFDSVKEAYFSKELNREFPLIIYSFHEEYVWVRPFYALDFEYIKHSIERYVKGVNFLYDRRHINPLNSNIKNKYGINIYNDLISYIEGLKATKEKIELPCFYLFYEHKQCMESRLAYLCEKGIECGDCYKEYKNISLQARQVLNRMIKVNIQSERKMGNGERDLIQVQNILTSMKNYEKEILLDVIDRLGRGDKL